MRVFSIFFHPSPSVTARGGAEKRFIETVKFFCRNNVQVTVIEPQPKLLTKFSTCPKTYSVSSPNVFVGKGWLSIYFSWVLWVIKACLCSLRVIKHSKYDAILAPNNTLPNLVSAYFVCLISHLPFCVVVHHMDILSPTNPSNFLTTFSAYRKVGYERIPSLIKTFAFFITLLILRHVDACITVSKTTAKFLIQNGVLKNKVHISGNGVHCQNIINNSRRRKKNESCRLYDGVFVGRIAKEKGVYDLVQAWQNIIQIKKDSKLVIVGSGPELPNLKRVIEESSLEKNVILKGGCTDEKMYELMRKSKVFVFPSVFEGWGLAVAEALTCGLPVVCYDISAVREIFGDCESVFFVHVGDVEGLTEKVLKIVSMNEVKCQKLSSVSRAYVKQFDWSRVLEEDLKTLKHVVYSAKL